jgi:hypothetical protein
MAHLVAQNPELFGGGLAALLVGATGWLFTRN